MIRDLAKERAMRKADVTLGAGGGQRRSRAPPDVPRDAALRQPEMRDGFGRALFFGNRDLGVPSMDGEEGE